MAVELGRKIFDSLKGVTVLVIGAGETAELAARHLVKAGVGNVVFANRTLSKAEELASRFSGQAVTMDDLTSHLATADIVICSTSSPDYVITSEMMRAARKGRKLTPVLSSTSVCRAISIRPSTPCGIPLSLTSMIWSLSSCQISTNDDEKQNAQK
jgi:glutamyl-tRNA reductase